MECYRHFVDLQCLRETHEHTAQVAAEDRMDREERFRTAQLEAHERVREASRTRGRVTIEPVLPVDILGASVLLPAVPREEGL